MIKFFTLLLIATALNVSKPAPDQPPVSTIDRIVVERVGVDRV